MTTPFDPTQLLTTPVAARAPMAPNGVLSPPAPEPAGRAAMALPVGTLLDGQFEVLGLIGQPGGFGMAYRCRDVKLGRTVVVKELFPLGVVMRAEDGADVVVVRPEHRVWFDQQCAQLLDEARRLAALDQVDAVVAVHEHFSANHTGYIVMHHVVGQPMTELLRGGKVDATQLMRWIWPLLQGLEAVHAAGVVHRDIKPDNVLIDQRGLPVLIDFGNAVAQGDGDAQAAAVRAAVTPHFCAPEQYANVLDTMGPWTDLYAVGALMYVALTGVRPIDARERLRGTPQPDIAELAPQTPALLADAIRDCLALEPARRPPDARSLRQRLAPLEPARRHWLDLLPDNRFGRRMRAMRAALKAGVGLPMIWNPAAGLLQGLWFFAHRLPMAGTASIAYTLAAVAAVLWDRDPWPTLPWALGIAWAAAIVPCALIAEQLRFRQLDAIGRALPLANEQQAAEAQTLLVGRGHADLRLAWPGLALPLLLLGTAAWLNEQQLAVQRQVSQALQLPGMRDAVKRFVDAQGRTPTADEIPPHTPNGELRRVELRPGGLEVVLALPDVDGRRARWRLDEQGRWHCESVDLPPRFTPALCAAKP